MPLASETEKSFQGELSIGGRIPGFCESCVSGQHAECRDSDCRCLCRASVQKLMKAAAVVQRPSTTAGGILTCPNCVEGQPKRGDVYCRECGTSLTSGKRCRCGRPADMGDKFCGTCGQAFPVAAVPVSELSEEEAAALEARARQRPSDVEVPPTEVQ